MAAAVFPKLLALIILLAAIGAAGLLYFAPPPAAAQTTPTDYDANDNGLIDIRTPAQLSAMRHDLNGNGDATHADYIAAFPNRDTNAATRMGCPSGNCRGYELMDNLDLSATGTDYNPWTPIGSTSTATFDGNGRTITGLTVNLAGHAGLFRGLGSSGGVIRNLGLVNPNVRTTATDGEGVAGPLAAIIGPNAVVATSYVSGGTTTLASNTAIGGGLVGRNYGFIRYSYSTATVDAANRNGHFMGGLVGQNRHHIIDSYAAGPVRQGTGVNVRVGGFVGNISGNSVTITNSYCDTQSTGQTNCIGEATGNASATVTATTTAALQAPTGYTGLYANWNRDLDGNLWPDYPWNFGTTTTYPMLNTPAQRAALIPALIDHDANDNGLIDVGSIEQLDAIRYDLNGDGNPASTTPYEAAFPSRHRAAATRMGCPAGNCTGYELTADLTFAPGANWTPIGTYLNYFTATLDGNGHTLTNLNVNMTISNPAGLFQVLASGAVVRDLGLLAPTVRSQAMTQAVGSLAGSAAAGSTIQAVYVQGGTTTLTAASMRAGGLVGIAGGVIRASYSTAAINQEGTPANVYTGVLAGQLDGGAITASYAAGPNRAAAGTGSYHGGFVGQVQHTSTVITNSYCDGEVMVTAHCIASWGPGLTPANTTSQTGTTAGLQAPTGYTGIYENWKLDLDGDHELDYPWNFGNSRQYPRLHTPTQRAQAVPAPTDYDANDNGLIEIRSLAQLNAMRRDLNGNGDATHADYIIAFPHRITAAETRMGCPAGNCRGYELMADLDLSAPGSPYTSWTPIGHDFANSFRATFDGNGHTITGLNVDVAGHAGLFGRLAAGGVLREVGIINPTVQTQSSPDSAGGLVGQIASGGQVQRSYSIGGRITLVDQTTSGGGLVGSNFGAIRASYARTEIRTDFSRTNVYVGGLVGRNRGSITASYAAGAVSPTTNSVYVGGLVGRPQTGGTVTNSYCDAATGRTHCIGGSTPSAPATTTAALQTPTDYTGIYQHWNLDLDGDGEPDNPWDFGTPTDYPALRVITTSQDSPPPGGPRLAQPPQETPYNPALDHPEVYQNPRHEMAAECQVQRNADGEPETSQITFDLGSYQGAVILHLAIWNGEHFMSYESQDIPMPPFERDGQTATVRVTTNPAQTRFLLDSVSPTTNLVLGYADCHTDDAVPADSAPPESTTTSTEATPPPKVYTNARYEMTATCNVHHNADNEPESSLITFDLGNYQATVILSISLWNGEYYASLESHGLTAPTLERAGQAATVLVTTNPAETRFLLDGTPNGLRTNLLLGYADCHTAGE